MNTIALYTSLGSTSSKGLKEPSFPKLIHEYTPPVI